MENREVDLNGLYLKTLNELDMRLNDKFTKESLADIMISSGIVKQIEKKYVIRINKRIIANEISMRLNEVSHKVNLYTDSEFLATEIGKFWNFFKRII